MIIRVPTTAALAAVSRYNITPPAFSRVPDCTASGYRAYACLRARHPEDRVAWSLRLPV